jgi:crotonobetainyl-CoA:carnitine CoA-transferase CaiB-like acyl-CoA transferase
MVRQNEPSAQGAAGMALSGVRVLDMATLFPGPLAAAMLADFGADVVKVEGAAGDPLRITGEMKDGRSYVSSLTNRNKRAVQLDLDSAAGQADLRRLADAADVVIANQPPALLARWGMDWAQLSARNPRAILVLVSGFGASGPRAGTVAAGTQCEAFAGLLHLIGEPDGRPMPPSFPMGDIAGAIQAVNGTLLALYWRDANGGTGQVVDVAMYEGMLPFLGPLAAAWAPEKPVPKRSGGRLAGASPRNVYRTSDHRWISLAASTDAQSARVLQIIGRDDAATRAKYGRVEGRLEHAVELDRLVADWIITQTAEAALAAFAAARVPVAPLNDLASLQADPHVKARGNFVAMADAHLGTLTVPGPVPALSATPGAIRSAGPQPGQHTQEVLRDWLGER